ncbi:MAG: AarF/ABC1/UbiB kinase family protein [Dehalococcoidales bacterium]|nr:AarF/ABC1/UbiB kinase family protein [Dehalococcoidales bacterium]
MIQRQKSKRKSHFARYRQITMVLVKHRLADLIKTFGLEKFLPLHWVPPGNPWHKEVYTSSQRTRMALEELGTTFIKVGQILSTRTDIFPQDFTMELAKLQNSLSPLPLETIKKVIVDELGHPVEELFSSFDPKPLGVASIGQAHAATLKDGTEVVIKVRKPGVMEQVKEDLDILRQLAEGAAKRSEFSYHYNLTGIVEEIADTITAELDYIREGHSAEHFARFFQGDLSIHTPKIFWQHTTPRVIVLERIRGIGILDVADLDKAGFDRKALAKRSVNIWLKMVFEDGVFHADPHPGNLFVEADGRLGLIDFGMVGIVDDEVRDHLASAVRAIIERDADLLVDSILDLGAVAPVNSRETLRNDLKHIMGHYPQMAEFHLATNLGELFTVIRRNSVQLPANTFLLLKTMTMAQSLGRGLDPDFDFFQEIEPHVKKALKKRYSLSALLNQVPSAISDLAVFSVGLPNRLLRIVKSVERGELHFRTDVSGLELHLEHLERIVRMLVIGIIIAAIILGLAMVFLAYRLGR